MKEEEQSKQTNKKVQQPEAIEQTSHTRLAMLKCVCAHTLCFGFHFRIRNKKSDTFSFRFFAVESRRDIQIS